LGKKKQKRLKPRKRYIDIGEKPRIIDIDYKNVTLLKKFVSDRYKIYPKKLTRVSAKVQRKLTAEIKKSRIMGLLPFTERHRI